MLLKSMKVKPYKPYKQNMGLFTKCIKISPMEQEQLQLDSPSTVELYHFMVEFVPPGPQEAKLFVTSEENAYGIIGDTWYDGNVEPYTLKNKTLQKLSIQIEEHHHLANLCQQQSYYQCLASEFINKEKTLSNEPSSFIFDVLCL